MYYTYYFFVFVLYGIMYFLTPGGCPWRGSCAIHNYYYYYVQSNYSRNYDSTYIAVVPYSASNPRGRTMHVGVIGGGLAGSLAALVLRSRGLRATVLDAGQRHLGGRLAGGSHPDSGASFLRASEPGSQWAAVLAMLAREGLVAPWNGRFGLLGAQGGFLPREVLGSTSLAALMRDEVDAAEQGGVDFCNFLGSAEQPVHVGTPANASICAGICVAAGVEVRLATRVTNAQPLAHGKGWRLQLADGAPCGEVEATYDALVLATHDAEFAAGAVRAAAALSPHPDGAPIDEQAAARLAALADALSAQRAERTGAVFSWSGYYPRGTSAMLPFDGATTPSSPVVRFLARDGSRPGRPEARAEGELWTAITTGSFARTALATAPAGEAGDSERGGTAAAAVAAAVADEVGRLWSPFFGGEPHAVPRPTAAHAKRWGAGFASGTLGLQEDCVGLEPWRLAIAGEYLGSRSCGPAEAAAISGLEAGERVASWL